MLTPHTKLVARTYVNIRASFMCTTTTLSPHNHHHQLKNLSHIPSPPPLNGILSAKQIQKKEAYIYGYHFEKLRHDIVTQRWIEQVPCLTFAVMKTRLSIYICYNGGELNPALHNINKPILYLIKDIHS